MLNRRKFLGGMLAVSAAAIVPLTIETYPRIVGDGVHDDTAGLQAAFNGQPFIADGFVVRECNTVYINSGTYRLTDTLVLDNLGHADIRNAIFKHEHKGTCFLVRGQSVVNFRMNEFQHSGPLFDDGWRPWRQELRGVFHASA